MKKAPVGAPLFGVLLAFAVAAHPAKAQVPPSGLQLGANVTPFVGPAPGQGPAAAGGLRVNYTLPGYPAHGLLFQGDVLHGGWDGYQYAPLLTLADIEAFKARIGPNRYGALQVYRPWVGYTYYWLRFTPVGTNTYVAEFISEAQSPGARAKFEGK